MAGSNWVLVHCEYNLLNKNVIFKEFETNYVGISLLLTFFIKKTYFLTTLHQFETAIQFDLKFLIFFKTLDSRLGK